MPAIRPFRRPNAVASCRELGVGACEVPPFGAFILALSSEVQSHSNPCCTLREDLLVEVSKLPREGRFDYFLVESTGISEPPVAELRLGRRTVLTLPLLPPPQKNRSPPSDSSPETAAPGGISSLSRTSPV